MNDSKDKSASDDGSGSFATYLEYNRVLRAWFVAFGIGGPVLFLVNEDVAKRLAKAGELRLVVILFLLGAASQVIGAFINKIANWYMYESNHDDVDESKCNYRCAKWIIEQFWIDILLDLATIVLFGIAAWKVLTIFAGSS